MKISEKDPKETGREYALRVIKENVIDLELAPGSQISENELAEAMGISRTPVREALIVLSKAKIIEIYPQKRSVVSMVDEDLIEESRFMRYVMEPAVIELVCEKRTEEDLTALGENVRLQKFYLDSNQRDQVMRLDNAFHRRFYEIARKAELYELMQNMLVHFDRVRNMALYAISDMKIVQDHENMIEAIRGRDGEEAKRLMQKHLSRYKIDTVEIRKKYPMYFTK